MIKLRKEEEGFTLIELLVVIAIIGILSAVVLASLNTARSRGRDASAKGSMSSLRAQAEMGYTTNYLADLCTISGTTAGGLATLITAVTNQSNAPVCVQNAVTGNAPSGWASVVKLNDNTYFCVDSSGFAGTVAGAGVIAAANALGADVSCN